jgi:hypothetical protein
MSYRRGLFLAWIVASAVWIIWCLWQFPYSCFVYRAGPWCHYWDWPRYAEAVGVLIVPPALVLIFGLAIWWVGAGLRTSN